MKTIEKEVEQGRTVVRIAGTFDRTIAWRVREELMAASEGEVVLDFAGVRELSELALAVLANGIVGRRGRVLLRGLGHRYVRLLGFCGLVTDGAQPGTAHT